MKTILEDALRRLRESGSPQEQSLLSPVAVVGFDEIAREATLSVPSSFYRDQFIKRFLPQVRLLVERHGGGRPSIVCRIAPRPTEQMPLPTLAPAAGEARTVEPAPGSPLRSRRLAEKLTFDRFITGPSNQFAYSYSLSVAKNPGQNYNPLFLYGGSGLGKTHLLNAIALHVRDHFPTLRVVYQTAEEFTNRMIAHIQRKRDAGFRDAYRRQCDVLLIDDIQFIAGKERTTEEFFHIFNALYEGEKQIVLTSDLYPKEIAGIPERLRSRFTVGLIADIQPPELETRMAILKNKANFEGIALPEDVVYYVASVCVEHVRQLEGALMQLKAYASLVGREIDLDTAKDVLHSAGTREQRPVTVDGILRAVSGMYGVKVSDLRGARKHKALSYPRQQAMYLARKLTGLSYPEIGQRLGGKDHSTVIYAERRIHERLEKDPDLRRSLTALEEVARQKS
jgi:chromosomal replication initiator protein